MSSTDWDELTRRWQDLWNQQAEQTRNWFEAQSRLAEPPEGWGGTTASSADNLAAMTELWRSWNALSGSLGRKLPTITDTAGVAGGALGRVLDPMSLSLLGGSQVGDAIRRMVEGPRFADVGAMEQRTANVMQLWLDFQVAARSYEQVVAEAWTRASQRFGAELATRRADGTQTPPAKEALQLWLDTANETLLETHRSEAFLTAQRRLLRSGMDFLLAERELVETLVEPAGLPTRTEIDEVHRTVQDLKRRVRALEKERADVGRPSPNGGTAAATTEGEGL
jgi:hypothetical protein